MSRVGLRQDPGGLGAREMAAQRAGAARGREEGCGLVLSEGWVNWPLSSPDCEEDLEPPGCLPPPNRCLLHSCWRVTLPFSAPTPWGSATSSRTSSWPSWCVRPRTGAPRGWDSDGTHAMGPPGSSPGRGMGWGLHGLRGGQCPHRGDSDRRSPGRSCQMSCKGWTSWQEQQSFCSRAKAARDGKKQEPWGPFVQILPFISLSLHLEKRISVFTASKMEQNSSWRALSSIPHPWEPFPPSLLHGVEMSKVPVSPGPQRAWLLATLCTGSGDKIRSLPSTEYRFRSSLGLGRCVRDGVRAGADSVAACQPGVCGNQTCWEKLERGWGGCAQELLLAGKSLFFPEEPGQQVTL